MKDNFSTILTKDSDNLNESLLLEKKRQELITQGRKGANYAPSNQFRGKNRFERKKYSKVARNVSQFNDIDMNAFFKKDILTVGIRVQGETDYYIVKIKFEGVLKELQRYIKQNNNKFEYKVVLQALTRVFNTGDIYVNCTCPDFCLKGDTKIKLLSGEVLTVEELLDKFNSTTEDLYVYSTDEHGDFKPGKIKDVWISNYTKDMIRVTLDNGKVIETTPNHRYMLRDGSYKEAKDLKVKDSLMPLYFKLDNKGYEAVKSNSEGNTKFYSVYKAVANELLKDDIEAAKIRSGEDIIAIHHKDFNKLNNSPQNLLPMGVQEHYKYHYEHVFESGQLDKFLQAGKEYWEKQESRDKQAQVMSKVMRNYYANMPRDELHNLRVSQGYYSEEWKQKTSKSLKEVWKNYSKEEYDKRVAIMTESSRASAKKVSASLKEYYKNISDDERKKMSIRNSKNIKDAWKNNREKLMTQKRIESNHKKFQYERTPEIERARNITKIGNVINKIIAHNEIPSPETYEKYRTNGYPRYTKYFKDWDEVSEHFKLNHKVAKIEYIHYDTEIPVYDISVDTYNNFYVDAGVILHNCYRFDYWSTVNNYNSGNPQNIPAKITNPNNTKGSGCKHVLLVLANVEWLLRVASVINNYVNYAETHLQKLYADYIFPQIYGVKYSKEVQLQLTDTDEVTSDKELIDIANRLGRNRGRFSSTYQPDRAKGRNAFKKQIGATVEPKGNIKGNSSQKEESGSNDLKSGKNNNTTFNKRDNKKEDSIEPIDEK